ncbi:hypothetical protein FPQ18DRAFT_353037 [Pyronema domesticum]|uniref:FAD linked oxidase N-terminal domain-containing protein n=1 Tax=Pyronema omphalodes (strain CBS 100304) TaxID=1076935 RepID=U4L5Y6_PYROM|nr:hypothetical protein FPQ18DRAFT_353037 [Pyronema domesticum]CCX05425.1 Similar to hypothetical protein [Tuber melanosporum Mel28]; acc. no. XP_002837922 [Pyronema omphalodes CBS 100304]
MTSIINFISQLGLSSTDVELITSEILSGNHPQSSASESYAPASPQYPTSLTQPSTSRSNKVIGKPPPSFHQSYLTYLRARLPYPLILTLTTTSQISLALQILFQFSLPFSLRSGGHTPFPQFSLILLSLSSFTTLSLSPCRSLITVGPGLRWSDVHHHLTPHGLACLGGRVPTVGVGGLLLGG